MNYKNSIFTPYPLWKSVENGGSFEEFKLNILPELYLKPEVVEEVEHNIEVVRKLLIHSYFEYDFIDVALTQSVFTLEQALKIRYRVLNAKSFSGNFKKLIDWFYEGGFFETYNSGIVHQLRNIRNGKAHEEKNTLGGIVFLTKIKSSVILINDIYEDQELRKERKELIENLQLKLNESFKDGAILKTNDSNFIIDRISVAFINNKVNNPILSLIALPIYDPKIYLNEDKNYSTRPSIELRLNNWSFTKNEFRAINENKEEVMFSPIEKVENQNKYKAWKEECAKAKEIAIFNDLGASRKVNDVFLKELDLLHKQK